MSSDGNNEEIVLYCKYCGKLCMKLVSSTNENLGRLFFASPTLRLNTGCLTNLLKCIIGVIVLFLLLNWLYNGSNETSVFELLDV
ncbi:hypothetical protein LIER_38328 [Lithospermum erythrorhizon]|uniref:Uncharacterized protein n=1 Tax=Lithospermum erythrorhizon TaxID=34254 RepID=A0AAV3Q001_LITER